MMKWLRELNIWIKIIVVFIFIQMWGIFIQESYSFANYLWEPMRLLRAWDPSQIKNNELVKPLQLLRFNLMLLIYAAMFSPIWFFIQLKIYRNDIVLIRADFEQIRLDQVTMLDFEKEVASAIDAVHDDRLSQEMINKEVKSLFDNVVNFVTRFFGLKPEEFRAIMVYSGTHEKPYQFSKMRWGSPITGIQERYDLTIVTALLTLNATHSYWSKVHEQNPHGDTKSAIVIRNIGSFRLGCYIPFKQDIPDLKEKTEQLAKVITPFTLLGHIDKITQNVINYK